MRKLTIEEVQERLKSCKRREVPFRTELAALAPGEGLEITKDEWTRKSVPQTYYYSVRRSLGSRIRVKTLVEDQGYLLIPDSSVRVMSDRD